MNKFRCAIYTRKSSEEGLDQSFNSLDAQREACEAYVASQRGEGWSLSRNRYDDGGWSGGTMERPGLRQLLIDVSAGKIDVIVVYKVDRLTRSLADFAKMVELFDGNKVSFVSVTQAFNTTTSMGRLTLNVLLSFAQFEREVTGERIRDKLAASKAKGMWMGGYPPFGYDPDGRTLSINDAEAQMVRMIFGDYLRLGSVHALADELRQKGVRSKLWTSKSGTIRGGVEFSRGALFHMLRNRLYLGEIVHRKLAHPGQHAAIIDQDVFDEVQALLASRKAQRASKRSERALLTGLVYDAEGNRMTPAHSRGRAGRTYRYYVSTPLQRGGSLGESTLGRVAASNLDDAIVERLRSWRGTPSASARDALGGVISIKVEARKVELRLCLNSGGSHALTLAAGEQCWTEGEQVVVCTPIRCHLRGGKTSIVELESAGPRSRPDRSLISGLRRAHDELIKRNINLMERRVSLEAARGIDDPYQRKLSSLAFLAPDIQQKILEGRQPVGLTLSALLAMELPLDWGAQRKLLNFGS